MAKLFVLDLINNKQIAVRFHLKVCLNSLINKEMAVETKCNNTF